MDRRKFLQSLTALGTGSTLPAFALNETGAPIFAPEVRSTEGNAGAVFNTSERDTPRIGILAIGGAGSSIMSSLVDKLPYLACSIVIDTDPFSLRRSRASQRILVGNGNKLDAIGTVRLTAAAKPQIEQAVDGLDVVFILAGLGGKAGTEISPIVADITSNAGILTIAAAMTPFDFESDQCRRVAQAGSRELCQRVNGFVSLLPDEQFSQAAGDGMLIESVLNEVSATFEQLYRSTARNLGGQGLIGIAADDIEIVVFREADYAAFG